MYPSVELVLYPYPNESVAGWQALVCSMIARKWRDDCDAQESKDERMIEDEVLKSHEVVRGENNWCVTLFHPRACAFPYLYNVLTSYLVERVYEDTWMCPRE
jgi:hypothetical protein